MARPPVEPADIETPLPPEVERIMLRMFRAWPRFEFALSLWFVHLFRLDPDDAPILLGQMEAKTKIHKIIRLLTPQDSGNLKYFRQLNKDHVKHADVRNLLFHNPVVTTAAIGGETVLMVGDITRHFGGVMQVKGAPLADVVAATLFAEREARHLLRQLPRE